MSHDCINWEWGQRPGYISGHISTGGKKSSAQDHAANNEGAAQGWTLCQDFVITIYEHISTTSSSTPLRYSNFTALADGTR